jgi:hypothetical protein
MSSAPDIGTAAGLFAAALHPGRLRNLIVGSGGAAAAELGAEVLTIFNSGGY